MPTYEYACSSCQHAWEVEQSIKDDALTECPNCKHATAKRQISRGGGFILKGGGWYADLYSSSSNKPAPSSSESSGGAAPSGTSSGSSEGTGSTSTPSSGTSGGTSGTSGGTSGAGTSGGASSGSGTPGTSTKSSSVPAP